jgi:hypothetical protein
MINIPKDSWTQTCILYSQANISRIGRRVASVRSVAPARFR